MIIKPKTQLEGEYTIPGDKSISHRAIMFGAISKGETHIKNFLHGADCLATIDCFRKMGIKIEETPEEIIVHGKGLHGLAAPTSTLDVGNSGTTTRLISGILSGQDFSTVLSGDESLNSRPMNRIQIPLGEMGAKVESVNDDNCAPLRITPSSLSGITYESPVASAQVKSAVLLAGLYAKGTTQVIEPSLSRDHTERMLQQFGAKVTASQINIHGTSYPMATIEPPEELCAHPVLVPGDISSAAYFIGAGLIVPNAKILLKNVGINKTRAGILEVCEQMGAKIEYLNRIEGNGEPCADLLITSSTLTGTTIEGDLIPTLIDEIPMLAVLAAYATGTTIIKDAAELKVKESNRIDTVVSNLKAMGAHITATSDGMIIEGGHPLHGATIESHLDHRIAMSFAIAGLGASSETIINGSACVDVSFPGFFQTNLFS